MDRRFCESNTCDQDFLSDRSEMPSTREPSPEPFRDTAKRYGLREEDMFPYRDAFFTPDEQIPYMHSYSHLPSSSVQCHPMDSGLSLDYLAQFSSPEGCFTKHVESGICNLADNLSTGRVSQQSFFEMQRFSKKLNRDTTWLRVVHRGYGQFAWKHEWQNSNLTIVHGPSASEGDYVMIPDGLCAQRLVDKLTAANMKVRKLVWFREMKRANKSRVLFKWEPFRVSSTGDNYSYY